MGQYDLPKSNANSGDPRGMTEHIRATAVKYGIDPEVALRVARSEGLSTFQSTFHKNGVREPSFGAFQLYTGGGLGNAFQKETGLDPSDPKNEHATIDYALKHASKNGWGPWYGAQRVGIGEQEGIGASQKDVATGYGGVGSDAAASARAADAATNVVPPADPTPAAAPAEKQKDYGAIIGDTLQQMGVDMAKSAAAQNAATPARPAPVAPTPMPMPMTPIVDPKTQEAQRQQLAMAMQRLNSGKLF